MIDPVIFEFNVFGTVFALRWYGVLVMLGVLAGTWLAEKEIDRRGGKGEMLWDGLLWVLPAGILGARLWYVANATLGGTDYYLKNPLQILNIPQGGLHFFGGLLFGAIALLLYLRRRRADAWLFLDAIAPAALVGQALARPANYINQELYGQPTNLPWGIPIDAAHRLAAYADLQRYPVETTTFHPTFAYEMAWNFLAALLLLWLARQYEQRMKPGAVFAGWLLLAGIGRVLIEFFRPDQPTIPGTALSFTTLAAGLMAAAGAVLLLVRYGVLKVAVAGSWEQVYRIAPSDEAGAKSNRAGPPGGTGSRRARVTRATKRPTTRSKKSGRT